MKPCYVINYRTRVLLGAYAYISTGRKWALNNGPLPIIENEVLQLTTFTGASVGRCSETTEKLAVPNKEYVVHSNKPPPNTHGGRLLTREYGMKGLHTQL